VATVLATVAVAVVAVAVPGRALRRLRPTTALRDRA